MEIVSRKSIIFFLIVSIAVSCATQKKVTTEATKNEALIGQDSKVPAGYRQNFIKAIDYFRTDTSIHYQFKVLNTEVNNGRVRIFFNISDNQGKLYVKANDEKWKKAWCLIEEKLNTDNLPVKNYKLTSFSELDKVPNAFALVLDHSGSMGDDRIFTVQNAVANLLSNNKKDEDAFAVIKFDNKVLTEIALTKSQDELLEKYKFGGMQGFGGESASIDALDKAIDVLDTVPGYANKTAIVFTDGADNASKMKQDEVIKKARIKGIKIFTIDFGSATNESPMEQIAKKSGGCYYHIYKTDEFNQVFSDIYKRMKNLYVLEYKASFIGPIQFKLVLCNNNKKVEMIHSFNYEPAPGNFVYANILFDANKSTVKSNYHTEIERLSRIIKSNPNQKFEIGVHTDDVGEAKTNLSLSQKRADAIKAELVKKGVDPAKIIAKGYGESVPIADNKTKEGKSLNRRVELVIVE